MHPTRWPLPVPAFVDDGEVVSARVALPEARDAVLFALMDDALHACAEARFGREAGGDGEATFYHDGTTVPAEALVDARPGRAAGGWWYFVARVVQDGVGKAHLERRMRPRT